jgi:hypothetical protein
MLKQIVAGLFCTVIGGIILFVIIERDVRPALITPAASVENTGSRPAASAPVKRTGIVAATAETPSEASRNGKVPAESVTEDKHPETPIRDTYERVFSGDFLFELQSCVLRGKNLTCSFTVTNDLDSDRTLGLLIYWGPCSRAFDEEGNEYLSQSGQLGSESGTPGISGFGHTLISGVKTKAALEFEGIPSHVKLIKLLRVMFDSPLGRMNRLNADFRDVPVQER